MRDSRVCGVPVQRRTRPRATTPRPSPDSADPTCVSGGGHSYAAMFDKDWARCIAKVGFKALVAKRAGTDASEAQVRGWHHPVPVYTAQHGRQQSSDADATRPCASVPGFCGVQALASTAAVLQARYKDLCEIFDAYATHDSGGDPFCIQLNSWGVLMDNCRVTEASVRSQVSVRAVNMIFLVANKEVEVRATVALSCARLCR